jgi:sigma-B regulation protein RsbU (phosphoserine phosphatase)
MPARPPNVSDAPSHAMQCMEIRGSSQAVEESLTTPGLDAWVYSCPFEGAISGGDLHYLSVCGGGVITRLLVADVSGHGASVSDFSNLLRALLRKNINTKNQTRLVQALNREFGSLAQLQRFATAVIATYLATSRRLTICNAGHPRPVCFSASMGSWGFLDKQIGEVGNLPLGLDDESAYHQFTVALEKGDCVIVYTDALIEAADSSGRLLGEEGLLELCRELDPSEPLAFGPALLAAVERHRGGRPADDDVTLVSLRHNGEGPRRLSVRERIDVYAKVCGLKSY